MGTLKSSIKYNTMLMFVQTKWKEVLVGILISGCSFLIYQVAKGSFYTFYVAPTDIEYNTKAIGCLQSNIDSLCKSKVDVTTYKSDQLELKESINQLNVTITEFRKDVKDLYTIMLTQKKQ